MPGGSVKVTINAGGNASRALAAINARLESINKQAARARAPFDKLTTNLAQFSKVTGIGKVAGGLRSVASSGLAAFQSVTRIVTPLAAISGAASIAGMMRLATGWADFGTALGNTAYRAGLSAEQLQTLQNAGQLAGVGAEATASGMTSLRDNMVRMAAGTGSADVVGMMQALGFSVRDAKRFAADTTRALPELADRIAAIKDPTLQAQAATALFGAAGEAMLPFLRQGAAGIARYEEQARRYGVINGGGVAAANRLREAQTGLQLAVTGLGYAVAEQLAPTIVPLLGHMADWIAANREWISQEIGERVQRFAAYLEQVDWKSVGRDIDTVVDAVKGMVDAVGGIKPAAEIVLGFLAVSWLAKMIAPILAVSKALRSLPVQAEVAAKQANVELAKIKPRGNSFAGKVPGILGGTLSLLFGGGPNVNDDGTLKHMPDGLGTEDDLGKLRQERANDTSPGGRLGAFFSGLGQHLLGGGSAPNGVPQAGPTFGPQQPSGPAGQGEQAAVDIAQKHLGEGGAAINPFLAQGGATAVNAMTTAWCASFVNASLKAAGVEGSHSAIATSFLNWGAAVKPSDAQKGDVLVLSNGHTAGQTGGHVGFATGEHRIDPRTGHAQLRMLAGNSDHRVQYTWEDDDRIAARRKADPAGPTPSMPANVGTIASPGSGPAAAQPPKGTVNVAVQMPAKNEGQAAPSKSAPGLPPMKVEQSMVGYGNGRDR